MAAIQPTPQTARRRRSWKRWLRLRSLGFRDYAEYLRSPQWAAVRARYRASDLPQRCVLCEEERVQLHHLTYERVGEERLTDLGPLCSHCHQMLHELERRGDSGLDFAGLLDEERARRHRQEQQAKRAYADLLQLQERIALDRLPLPIRLGRMRKLAAKRGQDVSSELRVIERQIQRIERKVAR